jgi:hypothetical protein
MVAYRTAVDEPGILVVVAIEAVFLALDISLCAGPFGNCGIG